jgi:hypothetical protein
MQVSFNKYLHSLRLFYIAKYNYLFVKNTGKKVPIPQRAKVLPHQGSGTYF